MYFLKHSLRTFTPCEFSKKKKWVIKPLTMPCWLEWDIKLVNFNSMISKKRLLQNDIKYYRDFKCRLLYIKLHIFLSCVEQILECLYHSNCQSNYCGTGQTPYRHNEGCHWRSVFSFQGNVLNDTEWSRTKAV